MSNVRLDRFDDRGATGRLPACETIARSHRRVGKVAEDAVNAHAEKVEIFLRRVAVIIGVEPVVTQRPGDDLQAGCVSVGDDFGPADHFAASGRHQPALPRRDKVGIGGDLPEAFGGQQVGIGAAAARHRPVIGLVVWRLQDDIAGGIDVAAADQLQQAHRRKFAQMFEIGLFERLYDHRRGRG